MKTKSSMIKYNAKKEWSKAIIEHGISYPSEYVIRIFKGEYPALNLKKEGFEGKNICDVGFGDGRNLVLLQNCGFNVHGIEITEEIAVNVSEFLAKQGYANIDLRVGLNDNIPYEDAYFDYILSWNEIYYMGDQPDFNVYVKEFARALKQDGYLILSIPKKTCFIYKNSIEKSKGYNIIKDDYFKVRNDEILRVFENEQEIEETFSPYFKAFTFASIHDDCFGLEYHWHLCVCRKK